MNGNVAYIVISNCILILLTYILFSPTKHVIKETYYEALGVQSVGFPVVGHNGFGLTFEFLYI